MAPTNDFAFKQRKYMPIFQKASGKPTLYIEGYPYEDDEPMAETGFHAEQITTFSEKLSRYFEINTHIHIGVDNFVYYREGDITKFGATHVYVGLGVDNFPLHRSFYTWAEGAAPAAVFDFLSDSTLNRDGHEKVTLYLMDIGVQEYFFHQPEMKAPPDFRGWWRGPSGGIVEMVLDAQSGLFSEALNLWFRWADQLHSHVRLLRPYLPDDTPITTSREEHHLRMEETQRRQEAETLAAEEIQRRREAETLAAEETQRRQKVAAELERLRAQLANHQDESA